MKLITEEINEVEFLTEGKGNDKKYYVEGIFLQGNVKNRNGRIYPVETLQKEVKRYTEDYINKKRAYGELSHPENATINMERVSHVITELRQDGSNFYGKAKILDTPNGRIAKTLIDEGCQLAISTRGLGTLVKDREGANVVQDDFYLVTAGDLVADPSGPNCFVNGIMEGVEWDIRNGMIVPVVDEEKLLKEFSELLQRWC